MRLAIITLAILCLCACEDKDAWMDQYIGRDVQVAGVTGTIVRRFDGRFVVQFGAVEQYMAADLILARLGVKESGK